jgi:hypothetical protein
MIKSLELELLSDFEVDEHVCKIHFTNLRVIILIT